MTRTRWILNSSDVDKNQDWLHAQYILIIMTIPHSWSVYFTSQITLIIFSWSLKTKLVMEATTNNYCCVLDFKEI